MMISISHRNAPTYMWGILAHWWNKLMVRNIVGADPAVWGVGPRPLAFWDCGFEYCRGMDICCDCCVLSGRGLCDGRSLVQKSPTECGVFECGREASIMRLPWPNMGCCAVEKIGCTGLWHIMVNTEVSSTDLWQIIVFNKVGSSGLWHIMVPGEVGDTS